MSSRIRRLFTSQEYLIIERNSQYKSEYLAGEIYLLAGASKPHNLIAGNIFASLHAQMKNRPCRVYMSDMRVKVSPTGLYTYPDIAALCGEELFEDEEQDTLLNPGVIIEVLSKTTESYDREEKFEHYKRIDSLKEYRLVSQKKYYLEHYTRQPNNQWRLSQASGLEGQIEL